MTMMAMAPLQQMLVHRTSFAGQRAGAVEVEAAPDRFTASHQESGIFKHSDFLQVVHARVGKATEAPNVGAAAGSGNLAEEMRAAGMTDLSSPPSEDQLRAYYKQHAPHSELIKGHHYADASQAYRKDAEALPQGDPRRVTLEARARQLEYVEHMQEGGHKVSFPPTFAEVRGHFHDLRKAPAAQVADEYRDYCKAFYQHVQDVDPKADVVYDSESGTVRGESQKKIFQTNTPEKFQEVSDQRGLSADGRRLVDCEGYAWMGEQLFREAGFHQSGEGSYLLMRGNQQQDGSFEAHVMVQMQRGDDSFYISNNHAYDQPGKALDGARKALGLPSLANAPLYYGKSEREALVHGQMENDRYKVQIRPQGH